MSALPAVNLDFASEVQIDRLRILWKSTLGVTLLAGWAVLTLIALTRGSIVEPSFPFIALLLACLATRSLLNQGHYTRAAWTYTLGMVTAAGLAMIVGGPTVQQIAPFALPVIVFMVGLLLPPVHTLLALLVSSAVVIIVPMVVGSSFAAFTLLHVGAIGLNVVAAVLAIQVTGDLYQVTEWALLNYQRERTAANALFDSQQQLERSLRRAEALSERLQEANTALDQARAAAEEAKHYRGQFLANMSHELRTPLNAVIGFSETMLRFPAMYEGVRLPEAYEADLQQIYTSGRQLLTLINDILDLSKVDAGKLEMRMERLDLPEIIRGVAQTAVGLVGSKPIALRVELPAALPPIYADKARLSQVLLNLYSNAAKFTDQGEIVVRAAAAEEGVLIALRDTGSGVPADSLELIFEEFKQADTGRRDPRSGAGLGLAISRQLLLLMGGRIWAESQPGQGSTFYVLVQQYPEAAVPVTAGDAVAVA